MFLCMACFRWLPVPERERHHLAGRIGDVPQSPVTVPLCVDCHAFLSRWQEQRWTGHGILTAAVETYSAWCDLRALTLMRSGLMPDSRYAQKHRADHGILPPKALSTSPRPVEITSPKAWVLPLMSSLITLPEISGPMLATGETDVMFVPDPDGPSGEPFDIYVIGVD
jgi:hypothetical protein